MNINKNNQKKEPIEIINLDYPIQIGSETLHAINIYRRPKAGDLMGLKQGEEQTMQGIMQILSKISGETLDTIKELDLVDLGTVSQVVQSFLEGSPKIGGGS